MRDFDTIMKDSPSVGDVHIASAGIGGRRRRRRRQLMLVTPPKVAKDDSAFSFSVPIVKTDDALHTVYGWASVITENGAVVTDYQGDQIEEAELVKAAHEFVTSSRHGGVLHAMRDDGAPHKGGDVVESLVFTPDVQKALGVDLGKTGWFIGYHVDDPDAWELVKSGTLKAFSFGGVGRRVPV